MLQPRAYITFAPNSRLRHHDRERDKNASAFADRHETMKVTVKRWQAIAQWRWDTGASDEGDEDSDVCGICRVAYEGCCPACKMPGDDCPLMWGECTHVFHMHCIIKWLGTQASKQQCPMDRRPWVTAAQRNNADPVPPAPAMSSDLATPE